MKKINRAAIKFASLMLAVMFLMGIPSLAALADKTSGVGSEQLANSSIGQDVYTSNKDLLAIMPTDTSLGIDYSSNSKFITPFDPPVASAIPISNKAELEAISNNLNGSFYLTADIDLSGAQWAPIGDKINPFTGTFDGQGHIISNLTINIPNANGTENNGLFGYAKNGMIKNLGIESAAISCYRTYGSVNAGGICGISDSLIVNCYNTGMITIYSDIAGMEDYAVYAGGICGISNSPVSNCYNTGTVTAYSAYDPFNTLGYTYAGGICGLNNSSNYNCYNTGTVTALGCAGGICGSGSFISNCYNTGNVDAANMMYSTYAGGICGYSENPITNCYNMGTMTARNNRISTYSSVFSYTGGICGKSKSLVSYCYNTGNALSDDSGNICGYSTNVSNCYYLYRHEYEYGIQLTDSQMRQQSSFVGFDFDTVWGISPNYNNGYPYLRSLSPAGQTIISFTLNVMPSPNGTVSGAPSGQYPAGEQITLIATADADYVFDCWTAEGVTLTDINAPSITFTMPANPVTLTANFVQQPAELSGDATLANLTVSTGALKPAFNPNVTDYAVTVDSNISSINIIATTSDAQATVTGTGTKALVTGANSFDVTVTAENGATKTYTITVTRAANKTSVTVNGTVINYTIVNGVAVLQPTQAQMYAILNASGSNIMFDLSGQNAVDLYVGAGWFKNINKTITIITSGGSTSVKTKSLWNNSGKTRLVTVRNNKINFKNI